MLVTIVAILLGCWRVTTEALQDQQRAARIKALQVRVHKLQQKLETGKKRLTEIKGDCFRFQIPAEGC
jgi:hypothetical protein